MDSETPVENTDRELWRERVGDYYADSLHVTAQGKIGMNVGGSVIVMPIRSWHAIAKPAAAPHAAPREGEPTSLEQAIDCVAHAAEHSRTTHLSPEECRALHQHIASQQAALDAAREAEKALRENVPPEGTRYVVVSDPLLETMSDWSEPVQVRVAASNGGRYDLQFRRAARASHPEARDGE